MNFKKIEETINHIQTNLIQKQFINENNQENGRANKGATCFRCAKPNHNYRTCRNATESDKATITYLLKSHNFDMGKFAERVKEVQIRYNRSYSKDLKTLNLKTPTM